MTQPVHLLCGVPGSGKTWVMKQLTHLYACVQNDLHIGEPRVMLVRAVKTLAKNGHKPVLVDCPFAEREFKSQLEAEGLKVHPIFIVESPDTVAYRYKRREGREASQSILTRAHTIQDRAIEWDAPFGTSEGVFHKLASYL